MSAPRGLFRALLPLLALPLSRCQTGKEPPSDSGRPEDSGEDTAADTAPPATYVDGDGDGVSPERGDCDDDNPDVHQGRPEDCNGLDDNCDGRADEGFADTDGDGLPDCLDSETCDGLDNDGDGAIDEGFADADADGQADCLEVESCDGLDNNGDGVIDEGFDADGDGWGPCLAVPDCDDAAAGVNPGADELSGTEIDEDCDGLIDEGDWAAGDLVITELMANPSDVADPEGEWFELVNVSDRAVFLDGLTIRTDLHEYRISDTEYLKVESGARVVLGNNDDRASNGGVDVDGVVDGLSLQNGADSLALLADGALIDAVTWSSTSSGASLILDLLSQDATSNDDEGLWCDSRAPWATGSELGSPGAENGPCPQVDHDGDHFSEQDGDCDDADPGVGPGEAERWYDGFDQDCDGLSDDDADQDGHDADFQGGDDCDDADPLSWPGAAERWYDGVDQDCDGLSDYDQDYDGFARDADGGLDCDDADAAINPDQAELCDAADADEDCDGLADDAAPDALGKVEWYRDADGDSFGDADDSVLTCDAPAGFVSDDTDCDDGVASVYPGAAERWYDGVDQDCLGDDDYDADGDGAASDAYGGEDCDDEDAGVSPDATEVIGDGEDSDCDGVGDPLVEYGRIYSDTGLSSLGTSLAGVGDVDGDGLQDLLIGAPGHDKPVLNAGASFLFTGLGEGSTTSASATAVITGSAALDYAGLSVAGPGDVDGDGYDDLLVGAYGDDSGGADAGAAWLVLGPVTGSARASAVGLGWLGAARSDGAGASVAAVGDLTGDGSPELLIGAPFADAPRSDAGGVYLVYGPITAGGTLSSADGQWGGESSTDYAGIAVNGGGDVDGDGVGDLIVGAYNADGDAAQCGAAYLLLGPASGSGSLSDAEAQLKGQSRNDYTGYAVGTPADTNGDGYADLLVGAYLADALGSETGVAYLVEGPVSADLSLADASLTVTGAVRGDRLGYALDLVDLDGDGAAELLLGGPLNDDGGANAGALYVLVGGQTGTLSAADADALYLGDNRGHLGDAVAGAGDIDGDGVEDLLVGATADATGGTTGGLATLLLGVAR